MALRAVKEGETASPKSVTEAAESGTHRDLLVAMRSRIARAVEDPQTNPRDLAALTRRLADIARDIQLIDAQSDDPIGQAANTADAPFSAEAI